MSHAPETRRRRTFAIISHPDAGKTTLTEKLLLFSGAIQIAGSVKARKASRHATSDWMEIEKQRGISVASSVMQMQYRDHVINLLDTPGHKDFSEDTYRVLTAVDSALMVIDAANGVEAQTRRLIEVCRQRDTPIITFVNKMDREVRDPLDILDEVERELGMPCVPMTWPVGQGKSFGGIINLRTQAMTVFEAGSERRPQDFEAIPVSEADKLKARFGQDYEAAVESMELATGASPAFDREAFLAGKQTPVFFGSGVNNFGVMEVLDALVDLAPSPKSRTSSLVVNKQTVTKEVQPDDDAFSGVVFKVQANMDANHRDRIAFVRVCSGKYQPGMKLKVQRTAKELRPTSVVTFMSQRREAVDEAYAGDIVGFTTHGGVQLGDTITDGSVNLQLRWRTTRPPSPCAISYPTWSFHSSTCFPPTSKAASRCSSRSSPAFLLRPLLPLRAIASPACTRRSPARCSSTLRAPKSWTGKRCWPRSNRTPSAPRSTSMSPGVNRTGISPPGSG